MHPLHARSAQAILFGLFLTLFTSLAHSQAVDPLDGDGDGMSDLWEQIHNATSLLPGDDEDNDGCSNLVEAIAGTDPFDPSDCLKVGNVATTASSIVFTIDAEAGKKYRVLSSDSPGGPFLTVEVQDFPNPGATEYIPDADNPSEVISAVKSSSLVRKFYKMEVSDVDTDDDGVSDWAERETGTDPDSDVPSTSNASHGAADDLESLLSLLSVTVETIDPDAFEVHDALTKKSAMIRVTRSYNPDPGVPLFVPFDTAGATDPEKGSASGVDYALKVGGSGINAEIPLLASETQVDVEVDPVADSAPEVPENLRIRCWAGAPGDSQPLGEAAVHICDANPVPAHRKLYVAFLGREAGVLTTATGIATALVEGDNDLARVSVTFSNLTSEQNTAYIRIGNDLDVRNIPRGQASNVSWQIRAAHFKTSDQAMLNALRSGDCYIDITTENFGDGEISGIFRPATGSEAPPTPPAPPSIGDPEFPDLAGFDLDRDIYRLLTQATFGPTTDAYNEVKGMVDAAKTGGGTYLDGFEDWIDKQMDSAQTPSPSWTSLTMGADLEEFLIRNNAAINDNNDPEFKGAGFLIQNSAGNIVDSNLDNNNRPNWHNRRREWWTLVVNCQDQLRQRMAQALTEICIISENDGTVRDRHYGATHYWDQMAENAFGKYRDILHNVTYSPMMGIYLSHLKNQKASGSIFPDENYAREIMQLFTVGLVLRHDDGSLVLGSNGLPIPTYDQDDITELARVMTGFSFGKRHQSLSAPRYPNAQNQDIGPLQNNTNFNEGNNHRYWQGQWMNPMKIFSAYHDYGVKNMFAGKAGAVTIPARSPSNESNGNADLTDAHNALAGNPAAANYDASGGHPNTPVFISRLLIQRFVTANPSAGYLHRVTQAYKSNNGNLGDVIKAILLDYEARSLELADQIGSGKPKETLIHYAAVMRALKTKSGIPLDTIRTDNLSGYFPATWTADSPSKYVPNIDPFPQSEYDKFPAGSYRLRQNDTNTSLGMSPLRAPSVFNWFLPDYTLPGAISAAGLVSPELQIMTDSQVVNNINALWSLTWSSTALDDNPPSIVGFGGDNIFNIHRYQDKFGEQLPMPQIVIDRGYLTPGGNWSIPIGTDNQLDRLKPDFNELYDLYESTYDAARATVSNSVAHDQAIEALVDQVDLWFCTGYLKAKWGATPGVASPRKSVIDFCKSLRKQDKAGSANNFRNDVVNRVRYACYLVSILPQALVQR